MTRRSTRTQPTPSRPTREGPKWWAAAAAAITFVITGCGSDGESGPQLAGVSADAAATFEYVIPPGSGDRLDAGEPLDIFPAELNAKVGDTIRIINNDDRGHTVGPFFVGAGETLSQQFSSPGMFEGICTVHPSGEVVLNVEA